MGISKKTWAGWGFETTPFTAMAAPTVFAPTKMSMKKMIGKHRPDEERASRDKNQSTTNLTRKATADPKGDWYNDVHPYLLLAWFGLDTPTQPNVGTAPTVWKHAMSLADIPKTMTVFKGYDDGTNGYYMAGAAVSKLSLKWSADKTLEVDATIEGVQSKVTAAPPTPVFSTLRAFAGWEPIVKLATVASNDVNEVDIELTQQLEYWYPSYGQPDPVKVYFGAREAKVKFTARADTNTLWTTFDTGAQLSMEFDFIGDLIASTYHQELDMFFNKIDFDKVEHDTSKTNVLVKAEGTAITDIAGWVTAYAQNTIASYTV